MKKMCDVSIIIPIYNGEKWINKCFESILHQTAIGRLKLEICVCDDCSIDDTSTILEKWKSKLLEQNIKLSVFENKTENPKGVGFAKNRAVEISNGEYICFQDVDDIMLPNRILSQYQESIKLEKITIVGSKFNRIPSNSTNRYTDWANNMTSMQLNEQIYTSNGPTIIMPTWFMHREVFNRVGGFSEEGMGTPEDLIFFYKHLDNGGKVHRVNQVLVTYTFHLNATTFLIDEKTIWNIRIKRLQECVLPKWKCFTIWNGGKQGRRFFNSLDITNQQKVTAMCDVDSKKIGKNYVPFDSVLRKNLGIQIPIIHFTNASPPFVICIKMDLTNGEFEKNLHSLNLTESLDYVIFS